MPVTSGSVEDIPLLAEAYTNGLSNWSSVASKSINNSNTSSLTSKILASFLSILLITTITFKFNSSAFCNTKRVCGIGPSNASTTKSTPSTIFKTRSTSPPKSA